MKKRIIYCGLIAIALCLGLISVYRIKNAPLVSAPPSEQRVAVLFSSLAQMWVEAGGEVDITVGETVERGFAPDGVKLVDSGAGKSINVELLLSYAPDLIIYSEDIPAQAEAAQKAGQAGIKTQGFHVESYEDYRAAMEQMTALTQQDKSEMLAQTEEKIREITAAKRQDAPTVLFIRAGSSDSSTKAKGSEDHFAAAMLQELGCVHLADKMPELCDTLSMEAILEMDPEYVFISLMGKAEAAQGHVQEMLSRPDWQSLRAVKEGRVYILPKELFHFKPNGRWAEAYAYLAKKLEIRV